MKIVCTGHEGQIGSRLLKAGVEPLSCDVTNRGEVTQELSRVKPDVVLHLAAMTSVDWCEANYEKAMSVNTLGTNVLMELADKILGEGKVVLISSEQVFDGKKGMYTERDQPNPVNNYGYTKAGAEAVANLYGAKIIRISRCFDSKSADISAYMQKLEKHESVRVPDFFFRSYCHMDFIADAFLKYATRFKDMPPILHIAGSHSCSFYDLMMMIADEYGYDTDLVTPRGEESGYVPRPHRTGLNVSLATALKIPIYTIPQSIKRMKHERL